MAHLALFAAVCAVIPLGFYLARRRVERRLAERERRAVEDFARWRWLREGDGAAPPRP